MIDLSLGSLIVPPYQFCAGSAYIDADICDPFFWDPFQRIEYKLASSLY